jgi:hypothetical protein
VDRRFDLEPIRRAKPEALDDAHLLAVSLPLISERRVGREADGIHDERLAFPMPDRVAVEREIGILGMLAAVREDLPPLRVRLDENRHLPRREQHLDRIRLRHDRRHAVRHAVRGRTVLDLAALRGGLKFRQLGGVFRRERRGLGAAARSAAEGDFPQAAEIRQLRDRLPSVALRARLLRRQRRSDENRDQPNVA